jgi:hypothetical protein
MTEGDLAQLVGDLEPTAPAQAAALDEARRVVADALASGDGPLAHLRSLPVFTTLLGANIHAAATFGAREYSRSNPPSLERHLIAPMALTG